MRRSWRVGLVLVAMAWIGFIIDSGPNIAAPGMSADPSWYVPWLVLFAVLGASLVYLLRHDSPS